MRGNPTVSGHLLYAAGGIVKKFAGGLCVNEGFKLLEIKLRNAVSTILVRLSCWILLNEVLRCKPVGTSGAVQNP